MESMQYVNTHQTSRPSHVLCTGIVVTWALVLRTVVQSVISLNSYFRLVVPERLTNHQIAICCIT